MYLTETLNMVKTLSSLPHVFFILWLGYREGLVSDYTECPQAWLLGKEANTLFNHKLYSVRKGPVTLSCHCPEWQEFTA